MGASRPRWRVQAPAWVIIGLLMAMSITAYVVLLGDLDPPLDSFPLPIWALALAFLAAESWVVHLHFRSESGSFSLYEIPLVLGLIFAEPRSVWLAIVLGAGLALHFVRRQPPIKIVFNVANLSLHVALAATIVHAVGVDDVLSPPAWVLLAVATMAGGFLQILALATIISVTEGSMNRPQLLSMLLTGALISSANTSLALVAAILADVEPWSLVMLMITVVVLFTAYRAYVAERTQRERVEFLYSSTRALRDNPETTAAAAAVLDEATSMFRAARAELYLFPRPGEGGAGAVLRHESGATVVDPLDDPELASQLAALAGEPVVVTDSTGADLARILAPMGIRDAIVGVLPGANRDIGLLVVANRLGNVATFTAEDRRLFEALVQHAAVALENDQLEQALGEMRRLERDLAHQANHDSLTGLANRSLFGERLASSIDDGHPLSVLYIDLDDFKVINDSLGHDAGDQVLIEVARRMGNLIRPDDVAARLGGDEFAIILRQSEHPELVARRIIQSLHEPILFGDHDVQVGASIGYASLAGGVKVEATELLNDADIAMYAAKSNGKGSVVEFRSDMREAVSRQRRLRTQLRRAIDNDEFDVVYQPIVELATGRPVGAEALVRWQSSDGTQLPGTFIDEAERAGMVVSIDRNVLDKVVMTLDELPAPESEPLFVSVNLSARNFQQDDLVDHFARTLLTAGARPDRLVAEITETALLRDPDRTVEQLDELRQLGVRVALDDFGTGYSSLSYLRGLPVDILKIAQPFVADVQTDVTFVRAMVDLGKNLGLTIVAEGVETKEQWDVLRSLGCDLGQGYLFGRPMGRADLVPHLGAVRP